jgi:hypothetical protein
MANAEKLQELNEKAGQYNVTAERLERVEERIFTFVENEQKLRGPGWKFNPHELGKAEKDLYFVYLSKRNNFQRSLDECVHELLQALEVLVRVI